MIFSSNIGLCSTYACYYEKVGGTVKDISENIPFEIPDSWTWARGKEIFSPMESTKPQGDKFIYIDIDAINNKRQYIEKPKELEVKVAPSRASRKLHMGDTLFSIVRPYLKNIAFVEEKHADAIASTGFYVCCPYKNLYQKYVFYLMLTPFIIDSLMQHMKGDNSPSIKCSDIENQLYPIPPISKQNRIVAKIEELFKIIDAKA